MSSHDPLCRGYYQRHTDPKDCASCDLIWAVREDDRQVYDTNIGKLNAAYKRGYTDALEEAALIVEDYFDGTPHVAKVHVNAVMKYIRESQ